MTVEHWEVQGVMALSDKKFLHLLMQIKALESLLQICFIWNLKFKYWSMYRPKNLIAGKSDFVVMLSRGLISSGSGYKQFTSLLLKNISRPWVSTFFSGLQKMEYLVFQGCRDNLFALNHSFSFWNSRFTSWKKMESVDHFWHILCHLQKEREVEK